MNPRTWSLPITTLIVNSDFTRPNGTVVIDHSAYERLMAEAMQLRGALYCKDARYTHIVGDPLREFVTCGRCEECEAMASFDQFTEGQGET